MMSTSKNLGFKMDKNQSFKVLTVHFNSTEKSSTSQVDFSRANTASAASFNFDIAVLLK